MRNGGNLDLPQLGSQPRSETDQGRQTETNNKVLGQTKYDCFKKKCDSGSKYDCQRKKYDSGSKYDCYKKKYDSGSKYLSTTATRRV